MKMRPRVRFFLVALIAHLSSGRTGSSSYPDIPFHIPALVASIRGRRSTAFTAASSGERRLSANNPTPQHHHQPQTSGGNAVTAAPTDGRGRNNNNNTIPNHPQCVLAGLSTAVTNATRALLPLVPLIAEAPVLAEHARRAWPWARAAWRSWPFAFVVPLYPPERNTNFISAAASGRPVAAASAVTPYPLGRNANFVLAAASRRRSTATAARDPDAESDGRPGSPTGRYRANCLRATLDRRAAVRSMAVRFSGLCGAVTAPLGLPTGRPIAEEATTAAATEMARGKRSEGSYDRFAEGYDDLDGGWAASALGIEELRSRLLERATGRVLEVGVGTGLNLQHYRRNSVSAIEAIDISTGMLSRASARSEALGMAGLTRLRQMDVENLEFPSEAFDTVLDTFSLCVFSNPSAALREMARVCKPTGRVLLLENSKSDFAPLSAYQDLTASFLVGAGAAKGCFWNQDVEALVRGAGLRVQSSQPALPGGVFRTLECVPRVGS